MSNTARFPRATLCGYSSSRPLSLEQVVRRQLTIRGIHNYAPRHLLAAVEFLSAHHHRFPFADLVTQWLPLTSIADAFAQSRRPDAIRIGVRPAQAPPA